MIFSHRLRRLIAVVTYPGFLLAGCQQDSTEGQYHETQQILKDSQAALEANGIKLKRKRYPLGEAWVIDLQGATITDEMIKNLKMLDAVAEMDFSGSSLTDEQLIEISNARIGKTLFDVNLSNTSVGDRGIAQLESSQFLKRLNVADTNVTDAGIAKLQKLRESNSRIASPFKQVQVTN